MLFTPCCRLPVGCLRWLFNMPGSFPSVQWVGGVHRAVVKVNVDSATKYSDFKGDMLGYYFSHHLLPLQE